MAQSPKEDTLELPLRSNNHSAHEDEDSEPTESSGPPEEGCTPKRLLGHVADAVASVVFWYVLLFLYIPDWAGWTFLACLVISMVAWRFYRAYAAPQGPAEEVPYTCGYVRQGNKEMFLVATIHISPRAPKDVEEVIDKTRPDVTMIELDDERLDRMREPEPQPREVPRPRPEDLQAIQVTRPGHDSITMRAQRALWNGEFAGNVLQGPVVFDEGNTHGLKVSAGDQFDGGFALVQRGSPNGEFAPFALKAHLAFQSGAQAVFVINNSSRLPTSRVGGGDSIKGDLQVFARTCSCGFPPVPVMLLDQEDGEKLRTMCVESGSGGPSAELKVLPDSYPRRTLRKRLCQAAALLFSGIGILYGIIQCFSVEVGGEFLAAEIASKERGIPCTCIDVDLNRFWSRLGMAVVPTPCNILSSLWAWLAFPRVFFRLLFPPQGNVDVIGSMFLHGASFPLRTWVAFILAGFCASKVTNTLLEVFGMAGEQAAERSGAVTVESKEDRDILQAYIMLLIEMYMLPQIYDAVAASRDEAMYQSIVVKSRERGANRFVVVVGAGHANGILQRAQTRGLS